MREFCTSGSVGTSGRKRPGVTRQDSAADSVALRDTRADTFDSAASRDLVVDNTLSDTTAPIDARADRFVDQNNADSATPDLFTGKADRGPSPDAGSMPLAVTAAHDTCAMAESLDLTALAAGPIEFTVDTSGASSDYSISGCAFPDDVVFLRNVPSDLFLQCVSGTGRLFYKKFEIPDCSVALSFNVSTQCVGGRLGGPQTATDMALVICRDPALGAATVRLAH
jgi:hypothetical protein